ncbi:hypothetical protein G9X50_02850 [Cronobacter sakazakii]|uniref:hypothetical protein n=1 Tax=Cronobacter sakazakii TaxID=28141 RepID=UPI001411EEA7|nr:hypothetical protein [Cronobacter sakazakii]NHV12526.1 hypothetical protein [Cronobacter sakazakii]
MMMDIVLVLHSLLLLTKVSPFSPDGDLCSAGAFASARWFSFLQLAITDFIYHGRSLAACRRFFTALPCFKDSLFARYLLEESAFIRKSFSPVDNSQANVLPESIKCVNCAPIQFTNLLTASLLSRRAAWSQAGCNVQISYYYPVNSRGYIESILCVPHVTLLTAHRNIKLTIEQKLAHLSAVALKLLISFR